jgi:chromosome segregation ATPase
MTTRVLPILNTIGCLALTGLVVVQWRKERTLDSTLTNLRSELADSRIRIEEDAKQRAALERDISVLKESIEAIQKSAESSARDLAEKDELATRLEADLGSARDQVAAWESAIRERDARIQTLDADLAAARKRLDEAIARLKEAGAR